MATSPPLRILSVDPGLANFGMVEMEGKEILRARNQRIGRKGDCWEEILQGLGTALRDRKLQQPDLVVIENNIFGMHRTVPLNAFVQSAVGGYFLALDCPVYFMRPHDKFKTFRSFPMPTDAKKNMKTKSLFIANTLFENGIVFSSTQGCREAFLVCDHLCDALLQGLSLLEWDDPLPWKQNSLPSNDSSPQDSASSIGQPPPSCVEGGAGL